MSTTSILPFISSHVTASNYPGRSRPAIVPRAVTISRQAGCGAREIADKLAARLQALYHGEAQPWTVFDRNLMDKVLEDHQLPKHIAGFLPEDRIPLLEDMLEEVFGLHPPQETVVKQTAETILGLASVGNVILIGRGGNVVTSKLGHVLHVRLVAPLEQRIEHAREAYGLPPSEARSFCIREDLGRARYLKKHFNADIEDPLLYHLVINTGLVSYDTAARLIEESLLSLD